MADPGDQPPRLALRRALTRFIAAGVLVLLGVGVATVLLAEAISRDVAMRHAKERGITFARVVSGPLVNSGVREGDRDKLAEFSQVMDNRLMDTSIVHITVYDGTGRVIWSDRPGVRGRVVDLDRSVSRLFDTGGVFASPVKFDREAESAPGRTRDVLKVYVSTPDAEGDPIVVESSWSTEHVDEDARAVMVRLAPLPVGALLLFAAVMVPLALSFARRVETAQSQSRRSLQHALSAAELERRRVARDLHDGVMQDVGGAGYALAAAARALPMGAQTSRRLIDEVSGLLKDVGDSLRSLLADIYPPNLERDGLSQAVEELGRRAGDEGIEVDVHAGPGTDVLPLDVTRLCYRVVREAMRNVVRHAQASHVHVQILRRADDVVLSVADDGRGLSSKTPTQDSLGLRLLEDTLHDVGGTLALDSPESGGTVFTATVPLALSRT